MDAADKRHHGAAMAPVREVPCLASRRLDHRPFHVRAWAHGWVAAAEDGRVTILDVDAKVLGRFAIGSDIEAIALADDGRRFAWVTAGDVWIGTSDRPRARQLRRGGARSVQWRDGSRLLWCAGPRSRAEAEIAVLDVESASVVASATHPDKFGDSASLLFPHPDPARVILWMAAGQDGQLTLLATHRDNSLTLARVPPDNQGPACFDAEGRRYIAASYSVLTHRTWPECVEAGAVESPLADEDEDGAGEDVHLLPGGYASWMSDNGRIFVIDLSAAAVCDEIVLAGHPLRPVCEWFPKLVGERALSTDLAFTVPGPDGRMLTINHDHVVTVSRAIDWALGSHRKPQR